MLKNFETKLVIDLYNYESGETFLCHRDMRNGSNWEYERMEAQQCEHIFRKYFKKSNELLEDYTMAELNHLLDDTVTCGPGWTCKDDLDDFDIDENGCPVDIEAAPAYQLTIRITARLR